MAHATPRFTSHDLELLPDRLDDTRYEIIDGELYVAKQPGWNHQIVNGRILVALNVWGRETRAGQAAVAPGVVFAEDDGVAPDVAWISRPRMAGAFDEAGHLRIAPDLIAEVLSPGQTNEERDREAKLKLYSRRGVREYWIVDWRSRRVEVYRRSDAQLHLVETLGEDDVLRSPLLPGFGLPLRELFEDLLPS